jgi:paraquat-inducible protein A
MNEGRELSACPHCDKLLFVSRVAPGKTARCPRCDSRLYRGKRNSIDKTLALCISGLLLFLPAMLLPLFTFEVIGINIKANIFQAMGTILGKGYYFPAAMILLTSIIFPFSRLLLLFFVSLSLKIRRRTLFLPLLFRLYIHLEEWGMVDVYLIGIMVTLIKMRHTADISYELGFFTFCALVLISLACQVVLDRPLFWRRIEELERTDTDTGQVPLSRQLPATALAAGLLLCHDCGKLLPSTRTRCPRCGAAVHARKPNAVGRTWALIIAAAILFFPANELPIMRVDFLGIPTLSTIMDGIVYFFEEGSYSVGVIILTASVLVPLFKIVGLTIMLLSIHFRGQRWLRQQTKMFHFISFIGRWSMLDIFVIALLSALVQFGFFTTIQAAPAATWFTAVVVLSMFAALSFDPRRLWDACDPQNIRSDRTTDLPAPLS